MMRRHDLHSHAFRVWVAVLVLFIPAQIDRVIAQDVVSIPETTFTLPNGLTVVVSEDRSTPNVAVELWLRAGARYEERGHWGQAHFCEHLLGSTRLPTIRGRVLEGNAQTRRDFTRYFLLVPHEALEYALAAQADRLDYPLEAMTAKHLADNRDIVINEFRGNESRPFGFGSPTDIKVLVNGFGAQHPYGRPLQINSDVMTITDEDMRRWVAAHTLPSDAILLLVGNVSTTEARSLVERYFGPIAAVRPESPWARSRIVVEPIQPTPERRERMEVVSPVGRILGVWATPAYASPDADYLSLFVDVLAAPDVGRLYVRLVSVDRLASATLAEAQQEELAGAVRATVVLRPDADPLRAESAFLDEVDRLVRNGPTDAELRTAQARFFTKFAKRVEQLGWQESRIDILGEGALFRGDARAYREQLDRVAKATREDVMRAAQIWVRGHGYLLNAFPPQQMTAKEVIDRTKPVTLPSPLLPTFPSIGTSQLSNGLTIASVQRRGSLLVDVTVVIPTVRRSGTEDVAGIVAQALTDRDPLNRSTRAELWRQCIAVGCETSITTDVTATTVAVEILASNSDLALRAMASLFTSEALDAEASTRAVTAWQVRRASQDATARANEAVGIILGGGTLDKASPRVDEQSLETFRKSAFVTEHATLLITGDIRPELLDTTLKRVFGPLPRQQPSTWISGRPAVTGAIVPTRSAVYFINEPGRTQTLIVVGQRLGEITSETFTRAQLASAMAGTRVNANLREQHQWSYGAQGRLATASDGSVTLVISSEVQRDQTAAAITEIRRELEQHEPTAAELTRLPVYRRDLTQQISGSAATVAGVNAALAQLARRGMPLTTYPTLLRQAFDLDADSLREALRLIDPKVMVFVLVGDAAQVRPQLDAAGLAIITLPPEH